MGSRKAIANVRTIRWIARYYCGHTVEYKAVYVPTPETVVWCIRCREETAVHDIRPSKNLTPSTA